MSLAAVPAPPPIVAPVVASLPSSVVVVRDARQPMRTLLFDVVLRRAGTVLWQGRLRASSGAGASFSQQSDQSAACVAPDGRHTSVRATAGMRFSLFPAYGYGEDGVRVTARFERPAEPAGPGCDGAGTRVAELQATIRPEPNKPVGLAADADYAVALTLRPTD